MDEFGGAAMVGVVVVVFVNYGVHHYGLAVDCQGGVCGDCYPGF